MSKASNWFILSGGILIYFLFCFILHPVLGYMLDSDAVAYLTIARRAAQGEWMKSINGLWSPLNSWLMIPLIKQGYNPWMVAKVLNIVFGVVLIGLSFLHALKFIQNRVALVIFVFSVSIITAYQVYFQLFGDILQLLFVLLYLYILWSEHFIQQTGKAILCGLVMGLAFYAKAYTFVFFGLHYVVSLFWMYRHALSNKARYIKQGILGLSVFLSCILPWSFLLYKKYGVFSLSGLAGKLNMSWYINSGKSFKEDIDLLIPPPYSDSPSFWEDPYVSQAHLSSPFTSIQHFFKWIARVMYTSLETVQCMQQISFLAITILVLCIYFYFSKKRESFAEQQSLQLLIITCLVLPIGYMMMHVETRYLWLMLPLLFIAGLYYILNQITSRKVQHLLMGLLAFSFLIFPIMQLKDLRFKNKDLFEKAAWLKAQDIDGSFTSNISDAGQMWVIAYLNGSSFYTIERSAYNEDELVREMKRYGVQYYIFQAENNVLHKMSPSPEFFEQVAAGQDLVVYKLKRAI